MAYEFGRKAFDEVPKEPERGPGSGDFEPRRFWLPAPKKGEDLKATDICFVDGTMQSVFALREHNVKLGGKFGNYYPCIRNMDPLGCPLCHHKEEVDKKAPIATYDAKVFTIVNMTGYKSTKRNEWVKNYREILVVKGDTLKKFDNWFRKYQGFKGRLWSVTRTSDDDNIGDDWLPEGVLTDEEMKTRFGDASVPFEYETHSTFQIKTHEELLKVLERLTGETAAEKPAAASGSTRETAPRQQQPPQSQTPGEAPKTPPAQAGAADVPDKIPW